MLENNNLIEPKTDQENMNRPITQSLSIYSPRLGSPLPPVPKPANPNDLPSDSEPIILSTSDWKLNLWWDDDHTSTRFWVADKMTPDGQQGNAYSRNNVVWYYGDHPDYLLTCRRFWKRADFQILASGISFSKTLTMTYGISRTETETLSAEFGVEVGALSAKVSATFEKSITISTETTETKEWQYPAPPEGKTAVWILWQLVDEIVALDANNNPVSWPYGQCGCELYFPPGFPFTRKGDLGMRQARTLSPTEMFYADVTLFNA